MGTTPSSPALRLLGETQRGAPICRGCCKTDAPGEGTTWPIEMQNDQNPRPGFLESAMEHPRLVVVAIIAVVFVSMVLQLL